MSATQHALRPVPAGVPSSDLPSSPAVGGAGLRPHVTIRGLSKRFDKAVIYDKFDLDIPRGELISVFGPNGCGKSTLINMIAGLIPLDAGQVLFDGMLLSEIKFGYVFQNYREALFPWLRAFDNIAYPLKIKGVPKSERKDKVEQLVARLGVRIDLNKYPYQMSGGQQQLVSIMRALVVEPEILFLEAPFSQGLEKAREAMWELAHRASQSYGVTVVWADEETYPGHFEGRVLEMENGRIVRDSSKVESKADAP